MANKYSQLNQKFSLAQLLVDTNKALKHQNNHNTVIDEIASFLVGTAPNSVPVMQFCANPNMLLKAIGLPLKKHEDDKTFTVAQVFVRLSLLPLERLWVEYCTENVQCSTSGIFLLKQPNGVFKLYFACSENSPDNSNKSEVYTVYQGELSEQGFSVVPSYIRNQNDVPDAEALQNLQQSFYGSCVQHIHIIEQYPKDADRRYFWQDGYVGDGVAPLIAPSAPKGFGKTAPPPKKGNALPPLRELKVPASLQGQAAIAQPTQQATQQDSSPPSSSAAQAQEADTALPPSVLNKNDLSGAEGFAKILAIANTMRDRAHTPYVCDADFITNFVIPSLQRLSLETLLEGYFSSTPTPVLPFEPFLIKVAQPFACSPPSTAFCEVMGQVHRDKSSLSVWCLHYDSTKKVVAIGAYNVSAAGIHGHVYSLIPLSDDPRADPRGPAAFFLLAVSAMYAFRFTADPTPAEAETVVADAGAADGSVPPNVKDSFEEAKKTTQQKTKKSPNVFDISQNATREEGKKTGKPIRPLPLEAYKKKWVVGHKRAYPNKKGSENPQDYYFVAAHERLQPTNRNTGEVAETNDRRLTASIPANLIYQNGAFYIDAFPETPLPPQQNAMPGAGATFGTPNLGG